MKNDLFEEIIAANIFSNSRIVLVIDEFQSVDNTKDKVTSITKR